MNQAEAIHITTPLGFEPKDVPTTRCEYVIVNEEGDFYIGFVGKETRWGRIHDVCSLLSEEEIVDEIKTIAEMDTNQGVDRKYYVLRVADTDLSNIVLSA